MPEAELDNIATVTGSTRVHNLWRLRIWIKSQFALTNNSSQTLNPNCWTLYYHSSRTLKMHSFTSTTKCLTRFLPEPLHLHQRPQGLLLPPLSLQSILNPRVSPQFGSLPRQLRYRLRLKPLLINFLTRCRFMELTNIGRRPIGLRGPSSSLFFQN